VLLKRRRKNSEHQGLKKGRVEKKRGQDKEHNHRGNPEKKNCWVLAWRRVLWGKKKLRRHKINEHLGYSQFPKSG